MIVITNNLNVEVLSYRNYWQRLIWVGESYQEEVRWGYSGLERDGLWKYVTE